MKIKRLTKKRADYLIWRLEKLLDFWDKEIKYYRKQVLIIKLDLRGKKYKPKID